MSAFSFHDASVVPDLLAVCEGEGWVSPAVRTKVDIMIEHGLHPEQALIGTGVVSAEQYGEALSQLFDIPFVCRTDASVRYANLIPERILTDARAYVADRDASSALVAFADPSDPQALHAIDQALGRIGVTLVPAVTLSSDVSSMRAMAPSSAATLRRRLEAAFAQSGTTSFECGQMNANWYTHHEGVHACDRAWQKEYAPATSSALAMHLTRHMPTGWQVCHVPTSQGRIIRYTRENASPADTHPLDWSHVMQDNRRGGVRVIVHADQTTEKMLCDHFPVAEEETHWRDPSAVRMDRPYVYRVREADEREMALHMALSGRPVLILQEEKNTDWIRVLPPIGIPVSCLTRTVVPEGAAWTSHAL